MASGSGEIKEPRGCASSPNQSILESYPPARQRQSPLSSLARPLIPSMTQSSPPEDESRSHYRKGQGHLARRIRLRALQGLVRLPPGSHDIFLRIRGDGIPEEEGIHPRVPVSQHDPHAVHPNLEKQQVRTYALWYPFAPSLGAPFTSPCGSLPPPGRSRAATSLQLRLSRIRREISRSSRSPAAPRDLLVTGVLLGGSGRGVSRNAPSPRIVFGRSHVSCK